MVMTGIVCTCVTSVTLSFEMLFVFVGAHSGGMRARVEVMAATVHQEDIHVHRRWGRVLRTGDRTTNA